MTGIADLYETDFYAWTRHQARELRRLKSLRLNVALDLEHLAEEVRDVGTSERDACRSHAERILEHFVKLAYSPAEPPRRGGRRTVVEARAALHRKLTEALRKNLRRQLPKPYVTARKLSVLGLEEFAEDEAARLLPETCPWTLDDLLREDWYPVAPGTSQPARRGMTPNQWCP